MPLLYCPVASALPIHVGTRESTVKDTELICFKTFSIKATTCLEVEPMSLDWPLDPIARFDQFRPSSSSDDSIPAFARSRWTQDAIQPSQMVQSIAGRIPFLMGVCGVLFRTSGKDEYLQVLAPQFEVFLVLSFPEKKMQENQLFAFTRIFCPRMLF